MKKFTKLAFTGLLLACASTGYAGGGGHADRVCIPVDGTVTTTPIACELILPGGPPERVVLKSVGDRAMASSVLPD